MTEVTHQPLEPELDASTALIVSEQITRSAGGGPEKLSVSTSAIVAQTVAAIQARYAMAERHPRDPEKSATALLRECGEESFARVARYKKPMGSKAIEGLSIRFAEAAMREWGNLFTQVLLIHDDEQRRIVKVCATDLERNIYTDHDLAVSKTVERRYVKDGQRVLSSRVNSAGQTVHLVEATEDETQTKLLAQISKIKRNLILSILPQWLKKGCDEAIVATLTQEAKAKPEETKKRIVEAFASKNVAEIDLAGYIGHSLDSITAEELVELRAVFQAMADGEGTWQEILAAQPQKEGEAPVASDSPSQPKSQSQRAEEIKTKIRAQRGEMKGQ